MRLSISNVGIINKADIELSGLTVIAGYNATGKSTIGKVLFSLIGGFKSLYGRDYGKTLTYMGHYTSDVRYNVNVILKYVLKKHPVTNIPISDISISIPEAISDISIMGDFIKPYSYYCLLKNRQSIYDALKTQIRECFGSVDFRCIRSNVWSIADALSKIANVRTQMNTDEVLSRSLYNEFYGDVINVLSETASISLSDDKELCNIFINNQKKFPFEYRYLSKEYKTTVDKYDAVFIDNSLYLDDYNLLSGGVLFEDFKSKGLGLSFYNTVYPIQLHKWDLMKKIKYSLLSKNFLTSGTSNAISNITQINDGEFRADDNGGLEFFSSDGYKILPINVAAGNKMLGILQLLLQTEIIKKGTFIVIDEPENNIHPQKQIEIAKVFVEMVKQEYNLIITTHSPFILEGLRLYTQKEDIFTSKAHFYLTKNISKQVQVEDVSNCLSEIFQKFSAPLKQLFEE